MTQQFTFQQYEGWENKFTWAMALHKSETDFAAGEHLRAEVEQMINRWVVYGKQHEAELLVSQLTGDAIGFAEWGDVVKRLAGMEDKVLEVGNPFTDSIVQFYLQHEEHQQSLLGLFQAAAERKQLLNEHPGWVDDMNTGRAPHEVIVDKILDAFSGHSPFWAGVDAVKENIQDLNQAWIENPHRRHDEVYTTFARMLLTQALNVVMWKHVAESFREDIV